MITEDELRLMKEKIEECLQKMTIAGFEVEVKTATTENKYKNFDSLKIIEGLDLEGANSAGQMANSEAIDVNINLGEPQFLIGQGGQTLFEFQRILRILLNKKLGKNFYLNLDINDYKKKKIEYLKDLAISAADEVSANGQKKVLPPMSAYERRIIHSELSARQDITTQSQGEGLDRCVVVKPK